MTDRVKRSEKFVNKFKYDIRPIYVRQDAGRMNISVRVRKREIEKRADGYFDIRCQVHDIARERKGEWINFNSGLIDKMNFYPDSIEVVLKTQ
jgi:hypothetical protein